MTPFKGKVYVPGAAFPMPDYETATGRQLYTVSQMRSFAQRCADIERERCATECERRHANGNFAHDTREDCALAIRALGDEQ